MTVGAVALAVGLRPGIESVAAAPLVSPIASPTNKPLERVTKPATASMSAVPTPAASTSPQQPRSKLAPITVLLKKDTVIGIRIDQPISTETSHVDDKISAKVSRDVVVDGITAIPVGTRVEGQITQVERPTATNPRGKLSVRFTSLVRADNTRVAIVTDTISREASDASSSNGTAPDISAFSLVVSGGRTAPPPSGGSATSATPAPSRVRDAQLPAGSPLTLHLTSPLSITVDRDPQ